MGRSGAHDGGDAGLGVGEAVRCEPLHRGIERLRGRRESRGQVCADDEAQSQPEVAEERHQTLRMEAGAVGASSSPQGGEGQEKGCAAWRSTTPGKTPPSRGRGRGLVRSAALLEHGIVVAALQRHPVGLEVLRAGQVVGPGVPAPGPSSATPRRTGRRRALSPISTGLVMWWFGSILETPPVRFGASMPGSVSMTLSTSTVPAFVTARTHISKPMTWASIGSLVTALSFFLKAFQALMKASFVGFLTDWK